MNRNCKSIISIFFAIAAISPLASIAFPGAAVRPAGQSPLPQNALTIPVDSSAVHFSPGNWAGDHGRAGHLYRITWNNGAWCTWKWTQNSSGSRVRLLISNGIPGSAVSYFADGKLVENVPVPATGGIDIAGIAGQGKHVLTVYTSFSQQLSRWGDSNSFTISGLVVPPGSTVAKKRMPRRPWVMIVGDSITEGIGTPSNLNDYSFLVGQGLDRLGYDTCVTACGYSGWIQPGDASQDVPGYYIVHGSVNGRGGVYDPQSRWNKVDLSTSLLDSQGHISGDGTIGNQPDAIVFNYGTNECLHGAALSDTTSSITRSLAALRKAAPHAVIVVAIPFGLYSKDIYPNGMKYIDAIRRGVALYTGQSAHDFWNPVTLGAKPVSHKNVFGIDLGVGVSDAISSVPYGGGIHPNTAGHAYLASVFLAALVPILMTKH